MGTHNEGIFKMELDGSLERYPQVDVREKNFENFVIGDYKCVETAENGSAITTVQLCKNMGNDVTNAEAVEINASISREVWYPSVVNDVRYAYKIKPVLYMLKLLTGNGFGIGLSFVLGLVAFLLACSGALDTAINSDINYAVICKNFAVAAVTLLVSTFIISKCCNLKAYGLVNSKDIWIINFRDELIVPAKLTGVCQVGETVSQTKFMCNVMGVEYTIRGTSLFFNQKAAADVLNYVLSVNDIALQQYYPQWRADANFVKYYKDTLPTRGFAVNVYGETNAVLTDSVIINGVTYKGCTSAKKLIECYLDLVKSQYNDNKNDDQQLITAVKEYQNKLQ